MSRRIELYNELRVGIGTAMSKADRGRSKGRQYSIAS